MHHILKMEGKGKGMSPSDIRAEAKALKWKISDEEADEAIEFLVKMGLVKKKKPSKQNSN